MLQKQELLPALRLVWEVFAEDIAYTYTPEGVAEFQKFIKYENMLPLMQQGEIIFFGAFDEGSLKGVTAFKRMGHICLFYVKKDCQGKGIGRMLFTEVCNYCANQLRVSKITVNAAPGAAAKYQHMGMRQTDAEQDANGIRYIPMEMYMIPQNLQYGQQKKNNTGLLIAGIIAGILLLALLMAGGAMMLKKAYDKAGDSMKNQMEQWDDDPMAPDSPLWDERGTYGDDTEDGENAGSTESSGAAAIPEYIAKDLSYEIEEDSYTYTDEKQSTVINFNVRYPVLQGLDPAVEDKINDEIKKCAMQTVDRIYTNPSQEFKEKILGTQNPVLASVVTYKVCYANNNFISIIIEDMGAEGSQDEFYQHMRTLNIGIRDGKVFEVKDIVNLNGKFVEDWLEIMRDEAGEVMFLSELDEDDMLKTLGGESIDGNYVANFFVDKDGVEIGYDLNYVSGDPANLNFAWVTAPFSFEEIKPYQKDKEFWKFFD